MSKELIENPDALIQELHDKMKAHVTYAGVTGFEAVLQCKDDRQKRLTIKFLRRLEDIWNIFDAIWTKPHINDEMWDNYKIMWGDAAVLPEHKLLMKEIYKIRRQWVAYQRRINGTPKNTPKKQSGSEDTTRMDSVS